MSFVIVFKNKGCEVKLGKGKGKVDTKSSEATITEWVEKPGLVIGKTYHLKSKGKCHEAEYEGPGVAPVIALFRLE